MKHSQLTIRYVVRIVSTPIYSSSDSFFFLKKIWDKKLINVQEQVYILYLNDSNEVICWRCLNTGTDCSTLFDRKLAIAIALNCLASNIIIAHNHPSGSLTPSGADMEVTVKLQEAAEFMDIKLLDHVIISRNGYCSFRDKHLLTALLLTKYIIGSGIQDIIFPYII